MNSDSIPKLIRLAADARGFDDLELSRRTGLSRHQVSEALSGGTARVGTLVQIAHAVDLEVALVPKKAAPIRVGVVPTVVDKTMAKLYPGRVIQATNIGPNVLALDLEGTLISNACSVFVRPGLFKFLTCCRSLFPRIVVYTTVKELRFREIALVLAAEGSAPDWFADLEYISWQGRTKDLSLIPGAEPERSVLVDDQKVYVHPGQEDYWLPVEEFQPPYSSNDTGLELALEELVKRVLKSTQTK